MSAVFARIAWEWERLLWLGLTGWFAERLRRRATTPTVTDLTRRGTPAYPTSDDPSTVLE